MLWSKRATKDLVLCDGDDSSNRKTDSQKDTRRHNWHIIVIIHVINSEKGFISDQSSKYSWQIDSVLPWVCSVIDHRWWKNVVRTKRGKRGTAECVTNVVHGDIIYATTAPIIDHTQDQMKMCVSYHSAYYIVILTSPW